MSSECHECGEHTLECICAWVYTLKNICGAGCPCKFKEYDTHLNLLRSGIVDQESVAAPETPKVKYINVRGRLEHETIIKDKQWCHDLGLDQECEIIAYLKRWGSWLPE